MTLTSEYQYIGRSEAMRNLGAGYYYYLLLYAKTAGSAVTGKHTVSLKLRIACDLDVYFYSYASTGYGKADGQTAFSWSAQANPDQVWEKDLTAGGITYPRWAELGEGTAQVYVGYGVSKAVTLEGCFHRIEIADEPLYLPLALPMKVTATVTLPALVEPSVPTVSVAVANMGQPLTIRANRKSAALTHRITYEFQGRTGIIGENVADSVQWTPPLSLAQAIPNAAAAGATIYCQTYAGSEAVGEARSVAFTLAVPQTAATLPTATMTLAPQGSLPEAFAGLYIQDLTAVKVVSAAEGKLGASIRATAVTLEGSPYNGGKLSGSGRVTLTLSATDSRGFVGSVSQTLTVLPYVKPSLLPVDGVPAVLCGRCQADGSFSDTGQHLRIVARRSYSTLTAGGVQKNFCPIRYRINGGQWVTILEPTAEADQVDTAAMTNVTLSPTATYRIEVGVVDDVGNSASRLFTIPTLKVDVHLRKGGGGVAIGGYSTREGFECALPAYFSGLVQSPTVLGRYVADNGTTLLPNAGSALLGSNSSAGLLLMFDTQQPSRFGLYYYNFLNGSRSILQAVAAKDMTYITNVYGTVRAKDENGGSLEGRECYIVLPCAAVT